MTEEFFFDVFLGELLSADILLLHEFEIRMKWMFSIDDFHIDKSYYVQIKNKENLNFIPIDTNIIPKTF